MSDLPPDLPPEFYRDDGATVRVAFTAGGVLPTGTVYDLALAEAPPLLVVGLALPSEKSVAAGMVTEPQLMLAVPVEADPPPYAMKTTTLYVRAESLRAVAPDADRPGAGKAIPTYVPIERAHLTDLYAVARAMPDHEDRCQPSDELPGTCSCGHDTVASVIEAMERTSVLNRRPQG